MHIRSYGQSAFLLTDERSVFIDPCGDMMAAASQGIDFGNPPIEGA